MKRSALRNVLAGFALVIFFAALYFVFTGDWKALGGKKTLVLELDLEESMPEAKSPSPLADLTGSHQLTLRKAIEALEAASKDPRVKVLVARMGNGPGGLAQHQDLREAILRFRKAGKKAIAFAETFGEFSAGNSSYYLATAFDEINLQPSGDVGLTGLRIEATFFRGTLDKLEITPHGAQRYEYKSALDTFTEKGLTPANREALQSLIDSLYGQMVQGIAEQRKMTPERVRELVDSGPHLAVQARAAGLVDHLRYRDEVYEKARELAGEDSELLYLHKYLDEKGSPYRKGKKVAVIYGVGGVQRGESSENFLTGGVIMGSDTVTAAFRAAAEDDDVKAIIFRIDCPGGSYVASDAILREAGQARKKGKPLIISMGDVAASGGYIVALDADRVIAQPGSITGSIGVLALKLITRDFWANKLGVTYGELQTARNADMWSSLTDYSPEEWAKFNGMLDRIYNEFTGKVAEGRKMKIERVHEVAKGRVWSGEMAHKLGLIDELGGWHSAIAAARKAAGLDDDDPIKLVDFPKKKGLLEQFQKPKNSDQVEAFVQLAQALRPALRLARRLGLYDDEESSVVSMPEFERTR